MPGFYRARQWLGRGSSKLKEFLGLHDKYADFTIEAWFPDGGYLVYTGKPWGSSFNKILSLADKASRVSVNMNAGSFMKSHQQR